MCEICGPAHPTHFSMAMAAKGTVRATPVGVGAGPGPRGRERDGTRNSGPAQRIPTRVETPARAGARPMGPDIVANWFDDVKRQLRGH